MTSGHRRFAVLGVEISAVDLGTTVDTVERWVEERLPSYVCVTGVHGVMESQRDDALRRIHNQSGLTVPDGRPMVWCGRAAGAPEVGQVRGFDLMDGVSARAASRGWRCFFYGAAPGTADVAARNLTRRHPGLRVAGTRSPPFRELTADEDEADVARMNEAGADLVWVGLPTPKQERWMADHVGRVAAPVLLGVGGAFDMHAGLVRTAPKVVQRTGLEWVFRLAQDPRRLARRYLRNNPAFALRLLRGGRAALTVREERPAR